MKRIILVVVMCLAAYSASAQYADSELTVSFGRVYADDVKLSDAQAAALFAKLEEIDGMSRMKDYMYYRDKYKTGAWLTAGGCISSSAGFFMTLFGLLMAVSEPLGVPDPENGVSSTNVLGRGLLVGGSVFLYGGIGCSIAGISLIGRSNSNLKSMARTYNAFSRAYPSELSFGPTANGVGLALNF